MGPRFKVSSNRLEEPVIKLGTPGFKTNGLYTKKKKLSEILQRAITLSWEIYSKKLLNKFILKKVRGQQLKHDRLPTMQRHNKLTIPVDQCI